MWHLPLAQQMLLGAVDEERAEDDQSTKAKANADQQDAAAQLLLRRARHLIGLWLDPLAS